MEADQQRKLAELFDQLADEMEQHRPVTTGQVISVTGGDGDQVVGLNVDMTVSGDHTGTAIGNSVTVTAGGDPGEGSKQIVAELREAAEILKAGQAPVGLLRGLVKRSISFGSTIISGVTVDAIKRMLGM